MNALARYFFKGLIKRCTVNFHNILAHFIIKADSVLQHNMILLIV